MVRHTCVEIHTGTQALRLPKCWPRMSACTPRATYLRTFADRHGSHGHSHALNSTHTRQSPSEKAAGTQAQTENRGLLPSVRCPPQDWAWSSRVSWPMRRRRPPRPTPRARTSILLLRVYTSTNRFSSFLTRAGELTSRIRPLISNETVRRDIHHRGCREGEPG